MYSLKSIYTIVLVLVSLFSIFKDRSPFLEFIKVLKKLMISDTALFHMKFFAEFGEKKNQLHHTSIPDKLLFWGWC
jgi:hypothetical protein